MKTLLSLLASLGVFGVFMMIILWATMLLVMVYGLWLAFSASIVLGIVLLVEPSPLVIGLVMLLFHKNLAQMLIDFLSK